MWIANQWKDYEVIDTSKGEKLERGANTFLSVRILRSSGDTPRKPKKAGKR